MPVVDRRENSHRGHKVVRSFRSYCWILQILLGVVLVGPRASAKCEDHQHCTPLLERACMKPWAFLKVSVVAGLLCLSHGQATSPTATEVERTITGIHHQLGSYQRQYILETSTADRPFVSLCFAQSLDGKLALDVADSTTEDARTTSNLAISSQSSLLLTHALRSAHDAILVGGRTLSTDNPRLSNRLWGKDQRQPRPIVLDPSLRHFKLLGKCRKAKDMIVCYSQENEQDLPEDSDHGVAFLPCRTLHNGRLDLADVLVKLRRDCNIRSLMVEGGPRLLSSFLEARFVDCLCITVAPIILGSGIGIGLSHSWRLPRGIVRYHEFEDDVCLVAFPASRKAE